MNNKTPHAVIVKTRSKRQPFRVKYIGANGEVISVSEPLTTRRNVDKNIIAHIKLVAVNLPPQYQNICKMLVIDRTKKIQQRYYLYLDGLAEKLSDMPEL